MTITRQESGKQAATSPCRRTERPFGVQACPLLVRRGIAGKVATFFFHQKLDGNCVGVILADFPGLHGEHILRRALVELILLIEEVSHLVRDSKPWSRVCRRLQNILRAGDLRAGDHNFYLTCVEAFGIGIKLVLDMPSVHRSSQVK